MQTHRHHNFEIEVEGLDKTQRTEIHQDIKKCGLNLESKTVQKEGKNLITFCLIVKEQKEPYVGFVLKKKNIDTMAAVNFLARMTHNAIGNFTFCGTKDKRGETV